MQHPNSEAFLFRNTEIFMLARQRLCSVDCCVLQGKSYFVLMEDTRFHFSVVPVTKAVRWSSWLLGDCAQDIERNLFSSLTWIENNQVCHILGCRLLVALLRLLCLTVQYCRSLLAVTGILSLCVSTSLLLFGRPVSLLKHFVIIPVFRFLSWFTTSSLSSPL